VLARSVPRQSPPYRPLVEVVADQHVYELRDLRGTLVGFRFPDYAEGIEVGGYHLHFISAERDRGGHVLGCTIRRGVAQIDVAGGLHVELPPGVVLDSPALDHATRSALDRVERES
jgi:acetolactate decarboxylase